jgi:hypothetical protein
MWADRSVSGNGGGEGGRYGERVKLVLGIGVEAEFSIFICLGQTGIP